MFYYGLLIILGFILIGLVVFLIIYRIARSYLTSQKALADKIIEEAKQEAENYKKKAQLEVKEEWLKEKEKFDQATQERRQELEKLSKRLHDREQLLNVKDANLTARENELIKSQRDLANREKVLKAKTERLDQLITLQNERLERIANLSADEAKKELIKNLEAQAQLESSQYLKDIRERTQLEAERIAREIILLAIQRCALPCVSESTVSVVNLPSDDLKGRIIGREGRNIRAFESLTGVEVIIDDTPGAIVLSSFDPVRREIAKLAMEQLIADGRIHQSRIEEIVEKAKADVENTIISTAEAVLVEFNVSGVAPELVKLLGRLKYRTSYGQNVLLHSQEVAILAGIMAQELGLDPKIAERAGLLHDIGKAADLTIEGPHAKIGAELAAKYGEDEIIVNAIAAHHEEAEFQSPYAFLISAADSISGARPGARRDNFEAYVKRLQNLEKIAASFEGVEKVYAIQAGREVRVMVEPEKISDVEAENLARKIANQIQSELKYPGQIKVMVIRELRAVDYAR
ncbi:MAG: ribonuclease Y [candidate division WOR-3 bacterium]|nr:ribonuclease Y [candidate division WOR-3 bacterium]